MSELVAPDTVSTVPFWYVAVIAGCFTVFGAVLTLGATWLVARRKNRLDDVRRFEPDIIAAYIRFDEIADVLHNNALGDPEEEKRLYWETYREVLRIVTKLELIAPPSIYNVARDYQSIVSVFQANGMSNIVDVLEEMRLQIRIHLRVISGLAQIRRRRDMFLDELAPTKVGRMLDKFFSWYYARRDPHLRWQNRETRRLRKAATKKHQPLATPPEGRYSDEPPF